MAPWTEVCPSPTSTTKKNMGTAFFSCRLNQKHTSQHARLSHTLGKETGKPLIMMIFSSSMVAFGAPDASLAQPVYMHAT